MKQRLCIGIQNLQPGWKIILDQAGLWYEEINYSEELQQHYSIIIVNDKVTPQQEKVLKGFVSLGGSVLEVAEFGIFYDHNAISKKHIQTLCNKSEHPAFSHLCFIDAYSKLFLHKHSNIFEGLVHLNKTGEGNIGFFGADIPALLNSTGYIRKRFFNPSGNYPDEIVSKVSKHQIVESFIALVKELHFLRKLPFLKKWDSPKKEPVFCFRVDSDYGDQKAMDALYKIADENNISLTWFLHVVAHEEWLSHFKTYKNQEIALHGYHHGTSNSTQKTLANITKGRDLLKDAGFNPKGFCAPYGIFNKAVIKSYKNLSFTYCSDFTFSYDALPIQPDNNQPLQIPIHPICTGSLKRKNLSVSEMSTYFEFIMNNKIARFEPVIFYHHPLQTGLKAIERIFKYVKASNLCNLTFNQFADFWKKRISYSYKAFWDGNQLEISSFDSDELLIQISKNHQQFDLVPATNHANITAEKPEFEYSNQYLPEVEQVLEMRRKDFKLLKSSILDWKNRNRL